MKTFLTIVILIFSFASFAQGEETTFSYAKKTRLKGEDTAFIVHELSFKNNIISTCFHPPDSSLFIWTRENKTGKLSKKSKIHCINLETKSQVWAIEGIFDRKNAGGNLRLIKNDHLLVVSQDMVHAVNASNGEKEWEYRGSDILIHPNEKFLLDNRRFGFLTLSDINSGKEIWQVSTTLESLDNVIFKGDSSFMVLENGIHHCNLTTGNIKSLN